MNNKITSSVDTDLMMAKATTLATVDELPNGTVVIGNKAFDLVYANDAVNEEEISKTIVAGGAVYVKDYDGNWIENVTGDIIDVSVIPAVLYKNDDKVINFEKANKNQNEVSKEEVENKL
ncbi:hypothetical protein LL037_24475 [Clostridium estertheticum]|uniref:Uncharacterized protein n=1 Tax=Clostridium estertheticum TaxID=238834 RepID=A0AA47EHL8_9CLOT|nr:hypothetical protein [Clostridium estertheticum]MBU3155315.1 hypothetical protein [Clostridium estertheticum]MBU3197749.1 hypothetical protein [Clostridium estertheticum]WAG60373.1 hypothetical protein LL038_23090 [Clostridium estertheticum]WAG65551.1 hypothetical protein LL037_24475 [Clostridium estertheticum]